MNQFGWTIGQYGSALTGAKSGFEGTNVIAHANGLRALQVVEVNDVGFIQNGQVNRLARSLPQDFQKGLGHVGDVKAPANQCAHDEQIDPQSIATIFWVLFQQSFAEQGHRLAVSRAFGKREALGQAADANFGLHFREAFEHPNGRCDGGKT